MPRSWSRYWSRISAQKRGESYSQWILTVLLHVPIHKQVEFRLHFLDQEVEELVSEVVSLFESSLDLWRALLHRVKDVDLVRGHLLLILGYDWVLVNFLVGLVQKGGLLEHPRLIENFRRVLGLCRQRRLLPSESDVTRRGVGFRLLGSGSSDVGRRISNQGLVITVL